MRHETERSRPPDSRETVALPERPSSAAAESSSGAGWDPYEVWRTRVLLPRLAERDRVAASLLRGAPVLDTDALAATIGARSAGVLLTKLLDGRTPAAE
jgi:hypothetical protein